MESVLPHRRAVHHVPHGPHATASSGPGAAAAAATAAHKVRKGEGGGVGGWARGGGGRRACGARERREAWHGPRRRLQRVEV
jgi:hypothetical protein